MTTLFFGTARAPVPVDEQKVRATTDVVTPDAPPAEAQDAPDWNEREVDANPNLSGLATRQVASDWHETEKYAPSWAQTADVTESFASINRQQATSGTAAQREISGQQGHGTMAYAIGIEPTLREGAAFGADYFAVSERGAQDGVPDQMERPTNLDQDSIGQLAGAAKSATREATAASTYQVWYSNMTGR